MVPVNTAVEPLQPGGQSQDSERLITVSSPPRVEMAEFSYLNPPNFPTWEGPGVPAFSGWRGLKLRCPRPCPPRLSQPNATMIQNLSAHLVSSADSNTSHVVIPVGITSVCQAWAQLPRAGGSMVKNVQCPPQCPLLMPSGQGWGTRQVHCFVLSLDAPVSAHMEGSLCAPPVGEP